MSAADHVNLPCVQMAVKCPHHAPLRLQLARALLKNPIPRFVQMAIKIRIPRLYILHIPRALFHEPFFLLPADGHQDPHHTLLRLPPAQHRAAGKAFFR